MYGASPQQPTLLYYTYQTIAVSLISRNPEPGRWARLGLEIPSTTTKPTASGELTPHTLHTHHSCSTSAAVQCSAWLGILPFEIRTALHKPNLDTKFNNDVAHLTHRLTATATATSTIDLTSDTTLFLLLGFGSRVTSSAADDARWGFVALAH